MQERNDIYLPAMAKRKISSGRTRSGSVALGLGLGRLPLVGVASMRTTRIIAKHYGKRSRYSPDVKPLASASKSERKFASNCPTWGVVGGIGWSCTRKICVSWRHGINWSSRGWTIGSLGTPVQHPMVWVHRCAAGMNTRLTSAQTCRDWPRWRRNVEDKANKEAGDTRARNVGD